MTLIVAALSVDLVEKTSHLFWICPYTSIYFKHFWSFLTTTQRCADATLTLACCVHLSDAAVVLQVTYCAYGRLSCTPHTVYLAWRIKSVSGTTGWWNADDLNLPCSCSGCLRQIAEQITNCRALPVTDLSGVHWSKSPDLQSNKTWNECIWEYENLPGQCSSVTVMPPFRSPSALQVTYIFWAPIWVAKLLLYPIAIPKVILKLCH